MKKEKALSKLSTKAELPVVRELSDEDGVEQHKESIDDEMQGRRYKAQEVCKY